MPRIYWLLLLIGFTQPAAGNPELQMELTAGLGGQIVNGRSSEIGIRLFAGNTTHAELQFNDGNGDTSIAVTIEAQSTKRLWVAVNPEPPGPLVVRLVSSEGEVIESELELAYGDTPITIVSRHVSADQPRASHPAVSAIRPVVISSDSFPRNFQAYAGVTAMITDLASLSGLSSEQYRALANYLASCNVLLVSTTKPATLEQLRQLSGCGGHFVRGYQALEQIPALLQTLAAERRLKSPSTQSMLSLQQPAFRDQMASSLTLYLAGYIVFVALVNWRMSKTQYLLILPIIIAAAGILAWSGSGTIRSMSWIEAQSGDSHSRISTLLLLGGDRRGKVSVSVDGDAALSLFGDGSQSSLIRYSEQDGRHLLSADADLLRPLAWRLDRVGRQSLPYTLQLRQGQPEVILRGQSSTNQAILLWRGYTYRLPQLETGESWHPHESQKQLALSAPEKLLQRYLQHESPALLLPHAPRQENFTGPAQDRGWLVIRPGHGWTL